MCISLGQKGGSAESTKYSWKPKKFNKEFDTMKRHEQKNYTFDTAKSNTKENYKLEILWELTCAKEMPRTWKDMFMLCQGKPF